MPKILLLDIETAPMVVCAWELFDQTINPDWIISDGYVLCYAARWYGQKKVMFDSIRKSGEKKMLKGIHSLMDEADWIITYNGRKFDIPTLKKELVEAGFKPPSPHKDIDLYREMKKQFLFKSNKMDQIARAVGLTPKVGHPGPEMWLKCMDGDAASWRLMEKYNRGDIQTTLEIYEWFLPWLREHPNFGAYVDSDRPVCTSCGSERMQRRGYYTTSVSRFPKFQCTNCGRWMRSSTNEMPAKKRKSLMRPI